MVEIIGIKAAGVALMLGIFVALALLLRLLFGPKGRFREAHWDAPEDSAEAAGGERTAGAQRRAEGNIEALSRAFDMYALGFYGTAAAVDAQLDLKRRHTDNVVAAAREIAAREAVFADPARHRALIAAALFHDVGRFQQLRDYKTYADALSCNHALLGAKILRREGFVRDEPPAIRRLVGIAVALHNRVTVPAGVTGDARIVLEGLRDADKLDILRVLAEHLGPGTEPDPVVVMHLKTEGGVSPAIKAAFAARRAARYADMRTLNDFRMLVCTWLFEFHYSSSLMLLARSADLETITAGMDAAPDEQAEARRLVDEFLGPLRRAGA